MKIVFLCVVLCLAYSFADDVISTTTDSPEGRDLAGSTERCVGGEINKFFKKVGDSMRNVHAQMRDGMKSLSDMVKPKAKVETMEIVEAEGDDDKPPVWDVMTKSEDTSNGEDGEGLDNRFLIDAPAFCPTGQRMTPRGCRTVTK